MKLRGKRALPFKGGVPLVRFYGVLLWVSAAQDVKGMIDCERSPFPRGQHKKGNNKHVFIVIILEQSEPVDLLSPTTENEFDPHSQIEILVLLGVHRSFPTSNPRQFYKGSPPRFEKRILINTECNQFCIKFPQELMVAQGHASNTNLKRLNNQKNE